MEKDKDPFARKPRITRSPEVSIREEEEENYKRKRDRDSPSDAENRKRLADLKSTKRQKDLAEETEEESSGEEDQTKEVERAIRVESKEEYLEYVIRRFQENLHHIESATTRYSSGKVQFNREEQRVVRASRVDLYDCIMEVVARWSGINEKNAANEDKIKIYEQIVEGHNKRETIYQDKIQQLRSEIKELKKDRNRDIKGSATPKETKKVNDTVQKKPEKRNEEDENMTQRTKSYAQATKKEGIILGGRRIISKDGWKTPPTKTENTTTFRVEGKDRREIQKSLQTIIIPKEVEGASMACTIREDGFVRIRSKSEAQKEKIEAKLKKESLQVRETKKFEPSLMITGLSDAVCHSG